MLMIGGGIPGREFRSTPNTHAIHIYVKDADAVYQKALDAGAESIDEGRDQEYGERSGGVKDPAGNYWYIATHKGETYVPKGLHNVNAYLHPLRAEPVINFLKRAFGAQEIAKYASPDGVVHHAEIRVGDSVVEMGGTRQVSAATVHVLSICAGLRLCLPPRTRCRRNFDCRATRPSVRRPQRRSKRCVRQPVVHRHAR